MLRRHFAHITVFFFKFFGEIKMMQCSSFRSYLEWMQHCRAAEELADISQQDHSTKRKQIKEQCLDLKPYRDGCEVLLDLSEDAEIV